MTEYAQTLSFARLDDLLRGCAPTLIKMDVEDFETRALRGAEGTLNSPSLFAVMLEPVEDGAHAQLMRHGFERFSYEPELRRLVNHELATGTNFIRQGSCESRGASGLGTAQDV
jgi:hypothetical protein